MNYLPAITWLGIGLAAITLIDTLGAIASRKLGFNYSWLAPLSLIVYVACGYFISGKYTPHVALLSCGLLGFYDGSIGLWLSHRLKARTGLNQEEYALLKNPATTLLMILLACFFGWIGYLLT